MQSENETDAKVKQIEESQVEKIAFSGEKPDIKGLAEALKKTTTLRELDLTDCGLNSEETKTIAEAILLNPVLRRLDLSNNKIGDSGAELIGWAMELNPNLESLNLSNNGIGDEGAKALANSLKNNQKLESLELYDNQINADGAKSIARSLYSNATLTTLDLRNNMIPVTSHESFREVMRKSYSLSRVEGVGCDSLAEIAGRNIEISKCISSIKNSLSEASPDLTAVDDAMDKLEKLIPGIGTKKSPLGPQHPIAQDYQTVKERREEESNRPGLH